MPKQISPEGPEYKPARPQSQTYCHSTVMLFPAGLELPRQVIQGDVHFTEGHQQVIKKIGALPYGFLPVSAHLCDNRLERLLADLLQTSFYAEFAEACCVGALRLLRLSCGDQLFD